MGLRRLLSLLVTALAAVGVAAPASAKAGDYVVRPVETHEVTWITTPSSAAPHNVLNDAVKAPNAPELSDGYIYVHTNGSHTTEVGLAAPAIPAGETVTGARAYVFLESGSGRPVSVELRSGAAVLGTVALPAGQKAAWHEIAPAATPTLDELSNLRVRATTTGNGASTPSKVYAAYAAISTVAPAATDSAAPPAPTPPAPTADPTGTAPTPDGAPDAPPVPVAISAGTLSAAATGVLAVPLTCRLATVCEGTITTRLLGAAPRAARRRKVSKKKRFRIKPGQSKKINVRLDRRTSRYLRRKRRARVAVTIAMDGAAPVTKEVTVVERRGAKRRGSKRSATRRAGGKRRGGRSGGGKRGDRRGGR